MRFWFWRRNRKPKVSTLGPALGQLFRLMTIVGVTNQSTPDEENTLFLKRFNPRDTERSKRRKRRWTHDVVHSGQKQKKRSIFQRKFVVIPDGNLLFYWLAFVSLWVLFCWWTIIIREAYPEVQIQFKLTWIGLDAAAYNVEIQK